MWTILDVVMDMLRLGLWVTWPCSWSTLLVSCPLLPSSSLSWPLVGKEVDKKKRFHTGDNVKETIENNGDKVG